MGPEPLSDVPQWFTVMGSARSIAVLILTVASLLAGCLGGRPFGGQDDQASANGGSGPVLSAPTTWSTPAEADPDPELLPAAPTVQEAWWIERITAPQGEEASHLPRLLRLQYRGLGMERDEWGREVQAHRFVVGLREEDEYGGEISHPYLVSFEAETKAFLSALDLVSGNRYFWLDRGHGALSLSYESALYLFLIVGEMRAGGNGTATIRDFTYGRTPSNASIGNGCTTEEVVWGPNPIPAAARYWTCTRPGRSSPALSLMRSGDLEVSFEWVNGSFDLPAAPEATVLGPLNLPRAPWRRANPELEFSMWIPPYTQAGGSEDHFQSVADATLRNPLFLAEMATREPAYLAAYVGPMFESCLGCFRNAAGTTWASGDAVVLAIAEWTSAPPSPPIYYSREAVYAADPSLLKRPSRDDLPAELVSLGAIKSAYGPLLPPAVAIETWFVYPSAYERTGTVTAAYWSLASACAANSGGRLMIASAINGQWAVEGPYEIGQYNLCAIPYPSAPASPWLLPRDVLRDAAAALSMSAAGP